MPNRTIKSSAHASGQILRDALGSLFALELFAPSQSIYLISPWITDFVLLNNSFGQFRVLLPENEGSIRLSVVLNGLVSQGTDIYVITRPYENHDFLSRLDNAIRLKLAPNLHEKTLLTDHFYLRGSLNFTYSGLNRNDEHAELSTDRDDLAQARVAAKAVWEGLPA